MADSSLFYDLGRKARIYAAAGVREMWVVNAKTLVTPQHRAPGPQGYADTPDATPDQPLAPEFAPALSVTLGTFELE